MIGPVGGSGGWLSDPNDLKSPKKEHVFFCFIHIWGVGGRSDPNIDISIFFLNPSLTYYYWTFNKTEFI